MPSNTAWNDDPSTIHRPVEVEAFKRILADMVNLTPEHIQVLRCELAVLKTSRGLPEQSYIIKMVSSELGISELDVSAYLSECSIAMKIRDMGEE